MIKKIQLIALLLLGISGILRSQITIHGKVLDSSINKGVEFAIVQKEGTNLGCICDSSGGFALNNLKSIPDSLTFSCIGYESKKIYRKDIVSNTALKVKINVKVISLNEVNVLGSKSYKKSREILGSKKRSWSHSSPLYYASQKMRYFISNKNPSYITKFSFYINEIHGARRARVRIYTVDTIKQAPMNDLLISNLIVDNLKEGWNSVDLSKYQILVPKKGFFIGLESVVVDKDSFKKTGNNGWVTYYNDFKIGCVKELTTIAERHLLIGDQGKYGEMKVDKLANEWHIDKGRGFDLLYRVELVY